MSRANFSNWSSWIMKNRLVMKLTIIYLEKEQNKIRNIQTTSLQNISNLTKWQMLNSYCQRNKLSIYLKHQMSN